MKIGWFAFISHRDDKMNENIPKMNKEKWDPKSFKLMFIMLLRALLFLMAFKGDSYWNLFEAN